MTQGAPRKRMGAKTRQGRKKEPKGPGSAEALRDAAERLRAIEDEGPEIVFALVPASGRLTHVSRASDGLLGRSPKKLVGAELATLVHPADRADLAERLAAVAGGTRDRGTRVRLAHADGRWLTFAASFSARRRGRRVVEIVGLAREITARLEIEERLAESQRMLANMVANSPGVLWRLRLDRDVAKEFVSDGVMRQLGYTPEEFLRRRLIEYENNAHPDDVELVRRQVAEATRRRTPLDLQYRAFDVRGEIHWLRAAANPILGEDGRIEAWEGISTDVTGLLLAERAAREKEAELRPLRESGIIALFVLHLDGEVIDMNDAGLAMLGYTREELDRGALRRVDFSTPGLQEEARAGRRELRERGAVKPYGRQLRRKDGELVDVILGAARLDGETDRCIVFAIDVTEQRRAERALAERSASYRELFENSLEVIVFLDLEGRIVEANPAAATMMRVPVEDLFGRRDREFLSSEATAEHDEIWRRLLAGEIVKNESEILRPDGSRVRLEILSRAIRREGEIVRVLMSARDVTERHLLESQLRQAQKTEAVGTLAGGIAHDFNNMLTGILGFSELSLAMVGPGHPLRANLEAIHGTAERAAELTRRLLAYARKQVLRKEPIDLSRIVREFAVLLRRVVGEHIAVVLELAEPLDAVSGDRAQLEQVLLNLCVNARDAMPEGGRLAIETSSVRVGLGPGADALEPGAYVRLAVADTGRGIPPEIRSRIFEPFFTSKAVGEGTGLGLALVEGVVRQHGGRVQFASEPGRGTTFEVLLPAVSIPAGESHAEPRRGPVGKGERILVVEDEEGVRSLLKTVLDGAGYEVIAMRDGESAAAFLESTSSVVDLVVSDLVMPGVSGRELRRRARERHPELPFLFVSGYASPPPGEPSDEGDFELLEKPFRLDSLLERVRARLDSR